MSEHNQSVRVTSSPLAYFGVYVSLLVGVGLQILASRLNLGLFNTVVVLLIAFSQAAIVVLFSMHLRRSESVVKLSVLSSIFMLLVLFGMVLIDYTSRGWGLW
jgi:caa(3)-type oxidase subunit IV